MSGVNAVDDETVAITLTKPDATFLQCSRSTSLQRRCQGRYRSSGAPTIGNHPDGSGAFYPDHWITRPASRLQAQSRLLPEGRPYLDKFTFQIGAEPLIALLHLQKGQVDIAGDGIPPAKYPRGDELPRRARSSSSRRPSSRPAT